MRRMFYHATISNRIFHGSCFERDRHTSVFQKPTLIPRFRLDVSQVLRMDSMFASADMFNSDLSKWQVSRVTDMSEMFKENEMFNNNISDWDVSSVTDMSGMFNYAQNFNQNISNWNVSNVKSMRVMFEHAESFDQNLEAWDVQRRRLWSKLILPVIVPKQRKYY